MDTIMISLNLMQDISMAESVSDLKTIILSKVNHFDIDNFNYGIKVPSILTNEEPFIFSGYDPKWIEHYISNKYHEIDSTVIYSFRNTRPAAWTDAHFSTSKKLRQESRDAGLHHGYTYPIHGLSGEKGLFCIAGEKKINDEAAIYISALVPFIHQKILELELSEKTYFKDPCLTKREQDFLKLLAIGKTMEEISCIMSISYRTCVDYAEKIKRKCHCTSKSQLIAFAISKHIIHL